MIFLIIIKNISNSIIGDRALNRFGAGNRPQFSCISKQLKTKIQLQGTKCEQEFELDLKFYFFYFFLFFLGWVGPKSTSTGCMQKLQYSRNANRERGWGVGGPEGHKHNSHVCDNMLP